MEFRGANLARSDSDIDFELYRYNPSLAAATIAVVIFAILTALHTWRLVRAKTHYFIPFTIGGIFEVLGYCGRIWGHFDKESVGGYSIQAIFILVAPALYAASIYMILGRLMRTVRGEHLSLIRVAWVTRIFVAGDVVAFLVQAGGGAIMASGSYDMYKLGEKVTIVGLFIQICIFGFFVVTSVIFHARLRNQPTQVATHGHIPWTRYLVVLYATSGIILVRSIFRAIEYIQGNDGYLISHEVFLYIFDALFMAVVMAIFLIWYVDGLNRTKSNHMEESMSMDSMLVDEQPRK